MKKAMIATILVSMSFLATGCGMMNMGSEEAAIVKINTASALKGRTIESTLKLINSEKAELIK